MNTASPSPSEEHLSFVEDTVEAFRLMGQARTGSCCGGGGGGCGAIAGKKLVHGLLAGNLQSSLLCY